MAVTGNSFSERFSRWQVLVNNLKESQRPTTPNVAEQLAELDALLAEARAHQDRQAQFRAQSQDITKKLLEIARRGDRVRSRLGAFLQNEIGFTTEELIRYGLKPRRLPPKVRVKLVTPDPEPEPEIEQS
jgi:hypothetical protein